MMRPFTVAPLDLAGADPTKAIAPKPVSITVPADSVNGNYTVSWIGTAIAGVQYELQEKTGLAGTFASIYTGLAPRFTVSNNAAGSTYYYRVRSVPPLASGFVTSGWLEGVANGTLVTRTEITSPAAGANVVQGTPVTITVTVPAAPAGATVSRVEFFSNGILIGSGTAPAYSFSWTPAAGIATQNLSAMTTYSNNATSLSAVVPVLLTSSAPTITLDSPLNGAVFNLGTAIPLAATPSTIAGFNIFLVEFYDGATLVGYDFTAPYSFSYTPTTSGVRNLTAKAFYSNGAIATSPVTGVTVIPITIVNPNGGEILVSGQTYTVNWASIPSATLFHLRYFDGTAFQLIQANVTGNSFAWTVPTVATPNANVYFHIVAMDSTGVELGRDTSNATFTINPAVPAVTVVNPNGGEVLVSGQPFTVNWTSVPSATPFHLRYFVGTAFQLIQANATGNSFAWTVPTVVTPNANVYFHIVAMDSTGVELGRDTSNATFTINP